jgi:methylase of polypeptide subunit release factors
MKTEGKDINLNAIKTAEENLKKFKLPLNLN